MKLNRYILIVLLAITGSQLLGQPVITVRFANPELDCATQTYCVDVEFQSNTAGKQLFGMNVRFYYAEDVLEFLSFGEFAAGYAAVNPYPPYITTGSPTSGMGLFTFPGPSEYVNGAIQKTGTTSLTISTTGWTKLFNVCFHVDDPAVFSSNNFCPSLIWDLKENPIQGGISGNSGVVITVVNGTGSASSTENVVQFNWTYDGITGLPHGYPIETNCIDPACASAPKTILPMGQIVVPGTVGIPVTVLDFDNIGHFCLTFEYDPVVMTYSTYTGNPIFASPNAPVVVTDLTSTNGKRKVVMTFTGPGISIPDGDTLALITFTYINGLTNLEWVTDGVSCDYADGSGNPLPDTPYSSYYFDGSFELLEAPLTKIDSMISAVGDYATFPLLTFGFNDIQAGNLVIDYDESVLAFYQVVPNAMIAGSFTTNSTQPGRIELGWTGSSLSIPDGTSLAYLTFTYLGGTAPLTWFDNGTSCQFIHGSLGLPLYDSPASNYYKSGYIAPAEFIWTGETSNDWNNPSNWEDNIVPDQFTDVVIDAAAARTGYPTFDGDFTLGVNCKDLTLNGNAQFVITGDLTINPGHTLQFNGNGTIMVGGDWVNSGTFIPGLGTIDFTGNANASIAAGVAPDSYIAAYELSTFSAGRTPLAQGTAGPAGDDFHHDVSIGFTFNFLGTDYTTLRINTNGWVSLNLTGEDATSGDNTILFDNRSPMTVLAPWWDDLKTDALSSISHKTDGEAPDRVFIVDWNDMLSYTSGSTARLSFQVKIYETSNIIEFCYGDVVTGTFSPSEGATIGIKDATGGQGHFIEATQNSTFLVLACLKSQNDWPQVNYRFTPPVENEIEQFYRMVVSKTSGELTVQKDSHITGF